MSDPHNPRETGSVRLGGIVDRTPHPAARELRLDLTRSVMVGDGEPRQSTIRQRNRRKFPVVTLAEDLAELLFRAVRIRMFIWLTFRPRGRRASS